MTPLPRSAAPSRQGKPPASSAPPARPKLPPAPAAPQPAATPAPAPPAPARESITSQAAQARAAEGQPERAQRPAPTAERPVDQASISDEAGEEVAGEAPKPTDEALRDAYGAAARESTVQQARENEGSVEFTNALGDTESLDINQGDNVQHDEQTFRTYAVDVGGQTLQIEVAEGVDADEAIASSVDYLTQQPEQYRDELEKLEIHEKTGMELKGRPTKADSKDGTTRFFDGTNNLTQHIFDHEFGHQVGDSVEDAQADALETLEETMVGHETDPGREQVIPEGYTDAAKADANQVSDYGERGPGGEDFAEFWSLYSKAQREGPGALAELEQKFPNRYAATEEIWRSEAA